MKTIKRQAVKWAKGLHTEVTLTEDTKEDIISEMENIPSTDDPELRQAIKGILVQMTIDETLPSDLTTLDIDAIFDKAERILQGEA